MNKLPSIFTSLKALLMFAIGVPSFYLSFVFLYRPTAIVKLLNMGKDMLSFNTTILMCIILGVMLISRTLLLIWHRLHDMKPNAYIIWQLLELAIMSLFMALYITLMYRGEHSYFYMVGQCLYHAIIVCIYPYVTFNIALLWQESRSLPDATEDSLIRFRDNAQKLKLMVAQTAVLYIESEENYVHIWYLDGERIKDYMLRCSMKSLEPLMEKHSMIRCQRGYFVNPMHVKVLRRDKEGMISAELDCPDTRPIPVSPRYYDALSKLL